MRGHISSRNEDGTWYLTTISPKSWSQERTSAHNRITPEAAEELMKGMKGRYQVRYTGWLED